MSFRKGDSLAEEQNSASEANNNTAAAAQQPRQHNDGEKPAVPTLSSRMKESADPRVQEIKKTIEELKKQRSAQMAKARERQHRLAYKVSEQEAIAKLIDIEHKKPRKESIGKLKKARKDLEFRISTESLSLQQEKLLARQINDINARLDEALRLVRLERKKELIAKDIEQYTGELQGAAKALEELDAKLDGLYQNARKLLGITKYKPKQPRPRERQQPRTQDINLEDIVVIKKKGGSHEAKPETSSI